jgi:hypothetical protein
MNQNLSKKTRELITTIPLRIPYVVRWDETIEMWIAGNEQLDIWTQAATQYDAQVFFNEAAMRWFESCIKRGTVKEAIAG